MRKELPEINIAGHVGGNQKWLLGDPFMYLGGCAAIVACDLSIYFAEHFGLNKLYPFDLTQISKPNYKKFTKIMKPYLHPRIEGVSELYLFTDGFQQYSNNRDESRLKMYSLSADESFTTLTQAIIDQIKANMPVPFLLLQHKDKSLDDYSWHWFWISGYEKTETDLNVKVISYGKAVWFSFHRLWDSGYTRKGGMILFELDDINH